MKKKLLLITHGFPYGESERGFLTTEFEYLCKTFDVIIIALNTQQKLKYLLPSNARATQFCFPPLSFPAALAQIRYKDTKVELKNALKKCKAAKRLTRASKILSFSLRAKQIEPILEKTIAEERIDILYTYWCNQATLAAVRLKRKGLPIKVISRVHRADLYQEWFPGEWLPFHSEIDDGLDKLSFVCKEGKRYYLDTWRLSDQEKYSVDYLGTSAAKQTCLFQTALDPLVIVSCSNMIALKRVDLIIKALSLLQPDVRVDWYHIGDGECRQELEILAQQLPQFIHAHFVGHISNKEVKNYIYSLRAQLFITTSSSEGLPVSVQEAMSLGLPIIATDVGGMAELVLNKKTGFLLPKDTSPVEIAHAISRFTLLPEKQRKTMGTNAFDLWQQKYDANKNAQRFVEALQRI